MSSLAGWVSPKGKFYRIEPYRTLLEHAQILGMPKRIYNLIEKCQDVLDEQEGRWTKEQLEDKEDEYRDKLFNAMMEEGYIKISSDLDGNVYFEGIPESMKVLYPKLEDFAKKKRRTAKYEPILIRSLQTR